jgi:hypothetical protein
VSSSGPSLTLFFSFRIILLCIYLKKSWKEEYDNGLVKFRVRGGGNLLFDTSRVISRYKVELSCAKARSGTAAACLDSSGLESSTWAQARVSGKMILKICPVVFWFSLFPAKLLKTRRARAFLSSLTLPRYKDLRYNLHDFTWSRSARNQLIWWAPQGPRSS